MRKAMKRLIGTLAGVTVLLLLLIDPANAITITDATLSAGNVTVSGNKAAKNVPIFWEENLVQVATSTKGGAFTFTTADVPLDCVGTVSDGVSTVDVAIAGCTPPPATAFPATGQTTCWDPADTSDPIATIACAGTGQDGEIQAGATLSYTDNGDGTITDNNTGLMWEKKSDDGTINDKATSPTWADAFAVHIAGLNGGAGFAGYTDWRLPNVKELQGILNFENVGPAVSSAFNTGCAASCTVLTCSCTSEYYYWSSTTYAGYPAYAWVVSFNDGEVSVFDKTLNLLVRAVRGGL